MARRQVEVFTAGCPVCEPAVEMVKREACPDCEVTVHDLHSAEGQGRGRHYNLRTVPAVVVNGSVVSCCDNRGPNVEELRNAGVGQPLTSE